jgi:hypothetical protein
MMPKKDLLNFNSSRRSKVRLLKNLQTDRREVNLKVKNRVPNLPQLNNGTSDKLEFSDQNMSRNVKKTLRKNLVEKMKTFGIQNSATVNSNFILQALNTRKSNEDKNIKDSLNDTQKTNSNTIQDPSTYDRHTRESTNLENQKRVSRKQMIVVQDERKLSKDAEITDVQTTKAAKKFSLSENVTLQNKRGSVTNRTITNKKDSTVFETNDESSERKESVDNKNLIKSQTISSQVFSPEDSNPQQPSNPKKTWPMKPGY